MEMTTILGNAAMIAGIILVFAGMPQAYKIYKDKSAKDVSLLMFALILIGQMIWLLYGISLKNLPLIATNLGAGIVNLVIVILILRYRNGENIS